MCTDDLMPCVSLSYNEGQAVIHRRNLRSEGGLQPPGCIDAARGGRDSPAGQLILFVLLKFPEAGCIMLRGRLEMAGDCRDGRELCENEVNITMQNCKSDKENRNNGEFYS